MSLQVGTLTALLKLDKSDFDQGIDESGRKGSRFGGLVKKGAAVAAAGIAAAGAAAVAGAFKTAAYGDALDKTSSKLGVHTDFLQDAQHWASQNGISNESLEKSVGRLNQRLGDGSAEGNNYVQAMQDIGVETQDANGKVRDTESVMRDTIAALNGIEDPSARAAAATEIFGTKTARDLMPALEDGALTLEEATAAMDGMGRMTEEQIAASAEFSDKWDVIKTTVGNALRQGLVPVMEFLSGTVFPLIKERLIPALQALADWLGPKIEAAAAMIKPVFDRVVEIVGVVIDIISNPDITSDGWIGTVERIVVGFVELRDRVAAVIQTVIGWFRQGQSSMASIGAAMAGDSDSTWSKIMGIITSAVELIQTVVTNVMSAVQAFWDRFGQHILAFAERTWGRIQHVIDAALQVIQGVIDTVLGIITGDWSRAWDGIKAIVDGVWDLITNIVSQALDVIKTVLGAALAAISQAWSTAWNNIKSLLSSAWDAIKSAVSSGVSAVVDWLGRLPGRALSALSSLVGDLRGRGREAMQAMKDAIVDRAGQMVAWIGGLPQRILRGLGNLGLTLMDAGKDLIRGLINGIKNMAGNAANAAKDAVKGAVDSAKSFLKIGSPSKVFAEIGEDTMAGMSQGISRQAGDVIREVGRATEGMTDAAGTGGAAIDGSLLREVRRLRRELGRPNVTLQSAGNVSDDAHLAKAVLAR